MDGVEPTNCERTAEPSAPGVDLRPETPLAYAIVEIFGHRRHAGRIQEVEQFGAKMLRIDVPTEGDFAKGFVSHFYGGSSIFSLTMTDLDTVLRMNKPYEPVGIRRLPAPDDGPDEPDDDRPADDEDIAF